MDFSFSEDQLQIKDLAKQILSENCDDGFLMAYDKNSDRYSQKLWQLFADSGLLGTAIPEECGGSGFGLLEICLLLEEQGRHVAPLPLLPSLVLGGLPLAKYGSAAQQETHLASLATGKSILTAAIAEQSMALAMRTTCTATGKGDSWTLDGERIGVPFAQEASAILVPADTAHGVVFFLVTPQAGGLTIDYANSTNHEPLYNLTFKNTPAELLGTTAQGQEILDFIVDRANIAAAAVTIGACEEVLRRTAEFTTERKQFDTSIASFQNTTMKLADCYIDIECMRSAYFLALWQCMEDKPQARANIHTAKYWAAVGGDRVTHVCQHLHGGIGADVEYPLHRYYLWCKQMEISMGGGGSKQLAELGALLARDTTINLLPETA